MKNHIYLSPPSFWGLVVCVGLEESQTISHETSNPGTSVK